MNPDFSRSSTTRFTFCGLEWSDSTTISFSLDAIIRSEFQFVQYFGWWANISMLARWTLYLLNLSSMLAFSCCVKVQPHRAANSAQLGTLLNQLTTVCSAALISSTLDVSVHIRTRAYKALIGRLFHQLVETAVTAGTAPRVFWITG